MSKSIIPSDSLRRRYFFKVFANIVTGGAGVISQAVISRGLGATQYGDFNFLTDFFTQFLAFLNVGTSVAFYTKLSKRPHESKLVTFYLVYIHGAILIALLMVAAVVLMGWQGWVWPGQTTIFIFAAVIFAGINWIFSSTNDVVDAYGLTVFGEKAKAFQRLLGIGVILFLLHQQWVNMGSVFGFNYAVLLLSIISFIYICQKHGKAIGFKPLTAPEMKGYITEFYKYSHPLLLISLLSLATGIFDRWFLQIAGGGRQQGFYSLSFKIGAICFLLTSAMTQLITREFSIAYEKKDLAEMSRLFRRHIPLLYGITSIFACFVLVNADKVAIIIGGKDFKTAFLSVAIMAIYPMHQAYGQLSTAVFYATDQTRLCSKVVTVFLLLGIPVTYFLLAPTVHYGLGMGAIGLAIKMVAINILTTNVLLYFNAKFLHLPFGWYVRHQLISAGAFIALAFVATWGMDHCFPSAHVLLRFLGAGIGYAFIVLGAVYLFPGILGLSRQDIKSLLSKVQGLMKKEYL
jgi:O-antigen/teichoic acid export membrane protein